MYNAILADQIRDSYQRGKCTIEQALESIESNGLGEFKIALLKAWGVEMIPEPNWTDVQGDNGPEGEKALLDQLVDSIQEDDKQVKSAPAEETKDKVKIEAEQEKTPVTPEPEKVVVKEEVKVVPKKNTTTKKKAIVTDVSRNA